MKTVFLDAEYKCHTTNPNGAYKAVEAEFFSGKCDAFIEGYRFVPSGETWTRSDGDVFRGEMITPWKPYDQLAAAQAQYEADLADAAEAYREGVNSAYDQ